jgi:RNA polymerase sigma-70 factor (ECF subfamily)
LDYPSGLLTCIHRQWALAFFGFSESTEIHWLNFLLFAQRYSVSETPDINLDTVRLLIGKAREGDDSARSDLAQHVQSYVTIMADKNLERGVRTNVGPSDIVQQTLMQMVNGIEDFRGESTAEFYGWLNKIIQNEANRASRDLKRQKRDIRRQRSLDAQDSVVKKIHSPEDNHPTPGTEAIGNERIELFYRALEKLPEDYATVIRLRNLEELGFNEIGEKMDRSSDAASKLWFRAIVKFQKELDQIDGQIE